MIFLHSLDIREDTIAGIASGMGGGVAIIRVSGEKACEYVDKIFFTKSYIENHSDKAFKNWKSDCLQNGESHKVHYGFIVDEKDSIDDSKFENDDVCKNNSTYTIIDEVIVLTMKAPRSYTREDVVEIDCHSGPYVTKKILEILLKLGVRMAEPGEFTKRAFLNGRIDLAQAEAVMDVINASNSYALQNSFSQLQGSIGKIVGDLRNKILDNIAYIEAALDDPEHYDLTGFSDILSERIQDIYHELNQLYDSYDNGRIITEGIRTLILGKPNAGKSSLMNLMLGEERAIVTDIAGTTRDTLEESIQLDEMTLRLIDTAGIRDTDDVIEKIGVDKAIANIDKADFIIYVIDSTSLSDFDKVLSGLLSLQEDIEKNNSFFMDEEDLKILESIGDKEVLILLNKFDIVKSSLNNIEKFSNQKLFNNVLLFSTKENESLENLIQYMKDKFYHGKIGFNQEVYISNLRHKEAIQSAMQALQKVMESIEMNMPEDFFTIDMMEAYGELGTIIGETVEDDLADKIFKDFCMGK